MVTNNENVINDDTSLENDGQKATVNNPVTATEPDQSKSGTSGNRVVQNVAAGAVGAAAGIGGMMIASSFSLPDEPVENPASNSQPIPEPVQFIGAEVPIAHNVNDDMSFSQAFAAARHETGPGGVFEWHGGVYGTYYANEWQGFSDEYKQSFSSYPYQIESEQQLADASQSGNMIPPGAPLLAEETSEDNPHEEFPRNLSELDEPEVVADAPASEGDVVIINAEHIVIVGQEVTVVSAEVDGPDPALVDTDDSYEITVLDDQGNPVETPAGDFETDDFSSEGFQDTENFEIPLNMDDTNPATLLAGETSADFDNNADISNFV